MLSSAVEKIKMTEDRPNILCYANAMEVVMKIPKIIVNPLTQSVILSLSLSVSPSSKFSACKVTREAVLWSKKHYNALQLPRKLWDSGIPLSVMLVHWIHFNGH